MIRHDWGLYEIPVLEHSDYSHRLNHDYRRLGLPMGHILVAEVAVVPRPINIEPGTRLHNDLCNEIDQAKRDPILDLQMKDHYPYQFVLRSSQDPKESTDPLVLVDIEPRFSIFDDSSGNVQIANNEQRNSGTVVEDEHSMWRAVKRVA